ncbi:MAG: DUF86 domain-containing protein [Chloroflexi bacterium]|nr:DUF86 domain-containing protein [Chloroflexota bacterium]
MTRRDDTVLLQHMLDYAVEALQGIEGKEQLDVETDRFFMFGLIHMVEIIGEAARHVSESTQVAHPQMPWSAIIGMRNRLIHGYDQVNFDVLWRTIRDDLPILVEELQRILPERQQGAPRRPHRTGSLANAGNARGVG